MSYKKYKFGIYLARDLVGIFLLCFIISSCASIHKNKPIKKKQENGQYSRLFQVNDLNERAFAYYEYCLKETEPINKKFLENMEYTANQLLDVTLQKYGGTPEYVVKQITNRRADIQQQLSIHYHSKGCYSLEGSEAEENYRFISEITKKQIK